MFSYVYLIIFRVYKPKNRDHSNRLLIPGKIYLIISDNCFSYKEKFFRRSELHEICSTKLFMNYLTVRCHILFEQIFTQKMEMYPHNIWSATIGTSIGHFL